MKISYAIYPSSRWSLGGREYILRDVYTELLAMGVDIELHDPWAWDDQSKPDVLHVFGSEGYYHELVVRARSWGVKIVVSAVLVYADRRRERLAALWRHVDALVPATTVFRLRRDLLRAADAVVSASRDESEAAAVVQGVDRKRLQVIPYPLGREILDAGPELFTTTTGLRDVILSVGRIEPRKNTLALVRAARAVDAPLVLIGSADPAHPDYVRQVEAEVAQHPNAHLLLDVERTLVASAYTAARVHALVSHHETSGLASVEAAAAGSNVVTARMPGAYEYLGDEAWYADPNDGSDIRRQLEAALRAPRRAALSDRVRREHSVRAVAEQHLALYTSLIEKPRSDRKTAKR